MNQEVTLQFLFLRLPLLKPSMDTFGFLAPKKCRDSDLGTRRPTNRRVRRASAGALMVNVPPGMGVVVLYGLR